MKRKQKKFRFQYSALLLLAIIVIIFAGFISFVNIRKTTVAIPVRMNVPTIESTTPTTVQTIAPTLTISWKIYTDISGGYRVSIPSNWSAHSVNNSETVPNIISYNCFGNTYDQSPPYGAPCIQVTKTNYALQSVVSSYEQNFQSRNQKIYIERAIKLDGVAAEEFVVDSGVYENLKLDVIILIENEKLFNIQSEITDGIPFKIIFNSLQFE